MGEAGNGLKEIELMNEYGAYLPLWDDEGLMDDDELELSDSLRSDLQSFAIRWEASIPGEIFDDSWDGNRLMSRLVAAKYALRRLASLSRRRAETAEDAEMSRIGEELRVRLELELGAAYRVTYRHC